MSTPCARRSWRTSVELRVAPRRGRASSPDLVNCCGSPLLDAREQGSGCARSPRRGARAVEPRHGLEVVVEDVGLRVGDDVDQGLARRGSRASAPRSRRRAGARRIARIVCGEVARALVGQVVPVDARHHDVAQAERARRPAATCSGSPASSASGLALRHGAEATRAGADVAHDHEGRRLARPALVQVRTARALADGVEVQALASARAPAARCPAQRQALLEPRREPLARRSRAPSASGRSAGARGAGRRGSRGSSIAAMVPRRPGARPRRPPPSRRRAGRRRSASRRPAAAARAQARAERRVGGQEVEGARQLARRRRRHPEPVHLVRDQVRHAAHGRHDGGPPRTFASTTRSGAPSLSEHSTTASQAASHGATSGDRAGAGDDVAEALGRDLAHHVGPAGGPCPASRGGRPTARQRDGVERVPRGP